MAYIKGDERTDGCFLCDQASSLVLAIGEHAFVVMNKYPYNSGHLMIAPKRHIGLYELLEPDEHADIARLTTMSMNALNQTLAPHGYNIGVNQGIAAGAGVPDHIHMHIVPRWGGDTNFTVTVGETKVLPEMLEETLLRLKPHFS